MEAALSKLSHSYHKLGDDAKAFNARLSRDTLLDEISDETTALKIGTLSANYTAQVMQFADSLAHEQALASKEVAIGLQRSRTQMVIAGGLVVLAGSFGAFILDRRRRKTRFEKDAALLETQALRSQMNPHFIFNALNSINAYVQNNEAGKASDYLAQFARLMRMVLENSRHAEVPLKDDLDALRGYFELERARTNEKFDYSIEVDPSIDPERVMVPPLVLQPFVENAIWHGMARRTEKGHITLKVTMRGDPASGTGDLIMAVEDDGVGRNAKTVSGEAPDTAPRTAPVQGGSGEIPDEIPDSAVHGATRRRASGKTSLGTEITRGRLDLVAKQKGRPAGFKYVDVEKGTRVEVTLPATLAA